MSNNLRIDSQPPPYFSPPGFALACLIRLLATLAANLDSKVGLNRRIARCIAEELGDLINGNDQYIMPFRETLSSAAGRLCLGGSTGPGMLDSSAALYELAQAVYSIPQAPLSPPPQQHQQHPQAHSQQQHQQSQSIPSIAVRRPALPSFGNVPTTSFRPAALNQSFSNQNSVVTNGRRQSGGPLITSSPPTISITRSTLSSQQQALSRPALQHQAASFPPYNRFPHNAPPTVLATLVPTVLAPLLLPTVRVKSVSPKALPAEVVGLIVEFVQPLNYRQRLLQNISIARVCKSFYSAVRPRLMAEIHITSAFQLPRLDSLFKRDPTRAACVTFLTIDLDLESLRWRDDRPWYGASFQSVIKHLSAVKNVSLSFKNATPGTAKIAGDLCEVTGGAEPIFEQFGEAVEIRLYFSLSATDTSYLIQAPGKSLRRLYVNPMGEGTRVGHDGEVFSSHHPYEVLSIPHFIITPLQLLGLLPTSTSTLRHLDFSFPVPTNEVESIQTKELFTYLAPSLNRLSMHIKSTPTTSTSAYSSSSTSSNALASSESSLCPKFVEEFNWESIYAGLKVCSTLENLQIGGSTALPGQLITSLAALPSLGVLTLQPLYDQAGRQISICSELEKELASGQTFRGLADLVVHIPRLSDTDHVFSLRKLYEVCSGRNISLGIMGWSPGTIPGSRSIESGAKEEPK